MLENVFGKGGFNKNQVDCLWICAVKQQKPSRQVGPDNLLALGLLGEKDGVDVRENTTGGDGDAAEELVELFVVADGKLNVSGNDTGLLVVAGGVASKLKDLSAEVLEDGGDVDRGTSTNTGGVAALLQVAADTANRELETSL